MIATFLNSFSSVCNSLPCLLSLEDVLCTLRGVIGRRHPTTAQSKQLKQTLPTLSIVLDLVSSQVNGAKLLLHSVWF